MKTSFLGKPIPKHGKPRPKQRVRSGFFALLVLPAIAAGGLLSLQKQQLAAETTPRTTGGALARTMASTRTLGTTSTPPIVNPCESIFDANGKKISSPVSDAFHSTSDENHVQTLTSQLILFPLVPEGISGWTKDGKNIKDMASTEEQNKVCSQGFWTREVFYWFVYKALAILNWFATAVAILLTIYGGILYISGFANEANAKKAKGIIIGAYVGLAIVFLAKIMVYGAINLVSNENPERPGQPTSLEGG
jgi:hypothetical protein